MGNALSIRAAETRDLADITAIYRDAVLHGTGTFEIAPPDRVEMGARHARIVGARQPYLVAATAEGVQGYAYATAFRDRPAFRFTLEDSVYVAERARGRGVGHALLGALIEHATAAGFRQMVALIGDCANASSIALHARCGFAHSGVMTATGWKQDRWLDVVLMQRALGNGATTPGPTGGEISR